MKAWQPVPTMTVAIISLGIVSVIFLFLGIFILVAARNTVEIRVRYDEICEPESLCALKIIFQENISQPIYFYYELGSFYQNDRTYFKSKSSKQLKGNYLSSGELDDCEPAIYNKDMPTKYSITGDLLDPDQPAFPCGLIARSFFNDTFQLLKESEEVFINEEGISWSGDSVKYKNLDTSQKSLQWIDIENEHFVVWMRVAPLSGFKKLWGVIEDDLLEGNYTLNIMNSKHLSHSIPSTAFVSSSSRFPL